MKKKRKSFPIQQKTYYSIIVIDRKIRKNGYNYDELILKILYILEGLGKDDEMILYKNRIEICSIPKKNFRGIKE